MERLINRRQQGDLGEASAIEWLTSVGATVFLPFGHSPDVDLVAEAHGRLLRIQVKTSTQVHSTPRGHWRCAITLATKGGNQSWNGLTKRLDPARFDYLFVHTGGGRRWFIPCTALRPQTAIKLGGPRYSEFEIDPGHPLGELVFASGSVLESAPYSGEYPSGQRMATVNRPAQPSQVRILPPPFQPRSGFPPSRFDRRLSRGGEAILNQKRRLTIPRKACIEARMQDGDRVRVRSDGDGRLAIERIEPPPTLPGADPD